MEEVCLNTNPVVDKGDKDEVAVDGCQSGEFDGVSGEEQSELNTSSPTVGLEFNSFDEAYDFYNIYAKEQGFGIRVSNSWFRSKRKERYRAKLSCSSAGFKKKSEANNPRPETRTGCPAMIILRLVGSKKWRIIEVELGHNHPVNPQIKRFYKSHKRMILAAKQSHLPSQPVTEVHTIKLYRTPVLNPSCSAYSNVEARGGMAHVDSSKLLELKEGDAHAVYNYLCRMKLTNPNFFYLMDFDNEGCLRNLFWADAWSRATYSYFSDTVQIETTCLANKYEIPLVSFVGVNHHGQSVLLGCGFVGHDSAECFVWILRTWLECMLQLIPRVIITDQNKSLQAAVSEVFPKAFHCYSLWSIMHRVPEKLGGLKGYETIKRHLNKAVYDTVKIAEFETSWASMVKHHTLEDNKWLQSLYQERRLWAPVYLKDTFFAGMIPLQESERFDPFFDGYIHKNTSFKEFVDKYDLAIHRKRLRESMADVGSKSGVELKTKCNFEIQLSKVYTKEIFERFQSEVEGMYTCFNTRQVNVNGPIITYIVKERVEVEPNEKEVRCFEVLYETNQEDIRCICSLFNYKGYLCKHALNVLNYNGVEQIPARYILPRWCKDFKCRRLRDCDLSDLGVFDQMGMYANLLKFALPVVEKGAQSEEHHKIVLQEVQLLLNKLNLD